MRALGAVVVASYSVIVDSTQIIVETIDGSERVFNIPAGTVGFRDTNSGPYSHRVTATEEFPFHVVLVEFLDAEPQSQPMGLREIGSGIRLESQSPRGRAYRIALEPGQSTPAFARQKQSVLIALSQGRIVETGSNGSTRIWDFEPGRLSVVSPIKSTSIRNVSPERIELVEIETY